MPVAGHTYHIDRLACEVIVAELHRAGHNQTDLAAYLGTYQGTVSKRLRGHCKQPWSLGELLAIGKWLRIDLLGAIAKAEQERRVA